MMNGRVFLIPLLAALLAALAGGCGEKPPELPAEDLLEQAERLEQDGSYYRLGPDSPPGALEFYRQALARMQADGAGPEAVQPVQMKVEWLDALRLMTDEKFLQKADYPAAIAALTAFSENYGDHPDGQLAIFFRGVARLYDIDFQDCAGAISDFETFARRSGDHPMVAEAMYQIGHAKEFNLSEPDYPGAAAAYGRTIEMFGATDAEYAAAGDLARMAVERSLFNRGRLYERMGDASADRAEARRHYERAVADYRRLAAGAPGREGTEGDVFFDSARFTRYQYVYFRLGSLLADELSRRDEGIDVLRNMQRRWPDSPWFGRVEAKVEDIMLRSPSSAILAGGESASENESGTLPQAVVESTREKP